MNSEIVAKKRKSVFSFDLLFLSMLLFYPVVNEYLRQVILIFTRPIGIVFTTLFMDFVVWGILILLYLPTWMKRIKDNIIIRYFIILFLILVLFTVFPNDVFTLEVLMTLLFWTIPPMIFGSCLKYSNADKKSLYNVALIAFAISVVYMINYASGNNTEIKDNMGYAYTVLPCVLLFVSNLFNVEEINKKIWHWLVAIFSVGFLIMQGTRGPVLCVFIFILLMLFQKYGLTKFTVLISIVGAIITSIANSNWFKTFLVSVNTFFENVGFSTRIIDKFLQDELSVSTSRDKISEYLMEIIKSDPLAIRGLFADRSVTIGWYSSGVGIYAHNLILELLFDFGVIIGGVASIYLIYSVIRFLFRGTKEAFHIIALVVVCGFVQLFMSSSFLISPYFFMLIGMMHNKNIQKSGDYYAEKTAKVS